MRFATMRLYSSSVGWLSGGGGGGVAQPARATSMPNAIFLCMRRNGRGFAQAPSGERPEKRACAERRPRDAPGEGAGARAPAAREVERPAEHHRAHDARAEADHRAHGVRDADIVWRHALGEDERMG